MDPKSIKDLNPDKVETWEYMQQLARTVQRKHYPNSPYADDLISEATLKGIELLSTSLEVRSVRSFLYTGMRNTMSNYMYRVSKEETFSLDESLHQTIEMDSLVVRQPDKESLVSLTVIRLKPLLSTKTTDPLTSILESLLDGYSSEEQLSSEISHLLPLALYQLRRVLGGA